jgi:hypothetical protein
MSGTGGLGEVAGARLAPAPRAALLPTVVDPRGTRAARPRLGDLHEHRLPTTYVGGSVELIERLLVDDVLEAVPAQLTDPWDGHG